MITIQQLLTDHIDIWTSADTGKKSARGRNSSNTASVYGIRKLRELILDLAVRGKLVLQQPNDAPARELLTKINIEKSKLIAKKEIKQNKLLPPINNNEQPFELPNKWEWVRFGDVCSYIQRGKGPEYVDQSILLWFHKSALDGMAWILLKLDTFRIYSDSINKYEKIRHLREGDILGIPQELVL